MEIEDSSSATVSESKTSSARAKAEHLSRELLQAELDKALADLEDNEELRQGFLGQTGVHIGIRVLKSARRHFYQEEARLKERIALLREFLQQQCRGA